MWLFGRTEKEKQQLIMEVDAMSTQVDASNKALVSTFHLSLALVFVTWQLNVTVQQLWLFLDILVKKIVV